MSNDIIRMAREAGAWSQQFKNRDVEYVLSAESLERFVALAQAAERNKLAAWMVAQGYTTGHGDTMEDLLKELVWQVRESEREAMLHLALLHGAPWHFQEAIRARGKHD
jgi:hypothetical protein